MLGVAESILPELVRACSTLIRAAMQPSAGTLFVLRAAPTAPVTIQTHHLSRVLHPDLKWFIKSSLLTGVVSPDAGALAATTTSGLLLLLLLLRRAATLHA